MVCHWSTYLTLIISKGLPIIPPHAPANGKQWGCLRWHEANLFPNLQLLLSVPSDKRVDFLSSIEEKHLNRLLCINSSTFNHIFTIHNFCTIYNIQTFPFFSSKSQQFLYTYTHTRISCTYLYRSWEYWDLMRQYSLLIAKHYV